VLISMSVRPLLTTKMEIHTCSFFSHVYISIPNSVTQLMKDMYTVGVLVHGVYHTLPVSQH